MVGPAGTARCLKASFQGPDNPRTRPAVRATAHLEVIHYPNFPGDGQFTAEMTELGDFHASAEIKSDLKGLK